MSQTPGFSPDSPSTLKRALSLPLITFYGLGNILGAGIYVLIGKVVAHAGVFAPLSFVLAALLACLTAFTYAELAARYPLSAGEAVYVKHGLGLEALAALVGGLIVIAGIVSAATILRGAAGYLQVFFALPEALLLPAMVGLLGGLAAWGVTQSVLAAGLFTVLEIGGLLLIVGVGLPALGTTAPALDDLARLPAIDAWPGIMVGAFLAFYAFIGFEDMVNVAEEVRRPERNLPRAILLALAVSSLLYLGVALVAIGVMPAALLAESEAPLALLYQHVTGRDPVLITTIGVLAVINGALIQIIMVSRVAYGMSRERWLPRAFGRIHPRTRTPLIATALVSALVLLMALWAQTETLAKAASYLLLLVFSLANLALWRLKRTRPQPADIIDVPCWVPVAGGIASLAFVLIQGGIDLFT